MEDNQILRKNKDCLTTHLRNVTATVSNSSVHWPNLHTLCNDIPSHKVAEGLYIFRAATKSLRSSSEFRRSSNSSIQNDVHPWYFIHNIIRNRLLVSDWSAEFGYLSIFLWGSSNSPGTFLLYHFVLRFISTMLEGRWWDRRCVCTRFTHSSMGVQPFFGPWPLL
jgi:hypothetical protein